MTLENVLWEPWLLEFSVSFSPVVLLQESVTVF